MTNERQILVVLKKKFAEKHANAAIKHFLDAVQRFQETDWETSISKIGKFIEAIMKCLYLYCGKTLPPARQFKVSNIVRELSTLGSGQYDDTIRLLVPRACTFIYDISSNRGARHDPDEIDPNKMDASVAIPVASWVLAELIRFADAGSSSPNEAASLVEELIEKRFPLFEDIDGRTYVNATGISAFETGLLLLNKHYPKRVKRQELVDLIHRHNFKKGAAAVAVTRLKKYVDDLGDEWKLRGTGRIEAAKVQSKLHL